MAAFKWITDRDVEVTLRLDHDTEVGGRQLRKGTIVEARLGRADNSQLSLGDLPTWLLTGNAIVAEGGDPERIVGAGALADRLFRSRYNDASLRQDLLQAFKKNGIAEGEQGLIREDVSADFGNILLELMVAMHGQMSRTVVESIDSLKEQLTERLGIPRRSAVPAATIFEVKEWSENALRPTAYLRIRHAEANRHFVPAWRSWFWSCASRCLPRRGTANEIAPGLPVVLPRSKGELIFDLRVINVPSPGVLLYLRNHKWGLEIESEPGRVRHLTPDLKPPGIGSDAQDPGGFAWPVAWLVGDRDLDVHQWIRFRVSLPEALQVGAEPSDEWTRDWSGASNQKEPPKWWNSSQSLPGCFGWLVPPDGVDLNTLEFRANSFIGLNVLSKETQHLASLWAPELRVVTDGPTANHILPAKTWELQENGSAGIAVESVMTTIGGAEEESVPDFELRCAHLIRTRGRPYGARDWEQIAIQFDPRRRIADAFARPAYRRGIREISLGVELLIVCAGEPVDAYWTASSLRAELQEELNSLAPLGMRAWVLVPNPVSGVVSVMGRGGAILDTSLTQRIQVALYGDLWGGSASSHALNREDATASPARTTPYWNYVRRRYIAGLGAGQLGDDLAVKRTAEGFLNERAGPLTGVSLASFRVGFEISQKATRREDYEIGLPSRAIGGQRK